MPLIQPNYDESEVHRLPAGRYLARILSCEQRTGKESGNPYLAWKLETVSGEPAKHGQWLYYNTPISGAGVFRLKELASAAIANYDGGPFDTDLAVGREVMIDVIYKPDSKYASVDAVTPAPAFDKF